MTAKFEARLDLVPDTPGVYLMYDADDTVIYVGKALSLRKRLSNYFCKNPEGNAKVLAMIAKIARFETVLCQSELEAFILESNLIKQYKPHYNILLRDDKEYPYIKITEEPFPTISRTYHVEKEDGRGAKYYGPWLSGDIKRALAVLQEIFQLRTCKLKLPLNDKKVRPCLKYHIGHCEAPCAGKISKEDYAAKVLQAKNFLDGKYQGLLTELKAQMLCYSDKLEFEKAATVKRKLQALKVISQRQRIIDPQGKDMDVIAVAQNESEVSLQKLEIREGRMVGKANMFFARTEEGMEAYLEAFVRDHYAYQSKIPQEIVLPVQPKSAKLFTDYLQSLADHKVYLTVPVRGLKVQLLDMAEKNAVAALQRHALMGGKSDAGILRTLQSLSRDLHLPETPERIEAFDISNTGTDSRTASMVVFINGRPERKLYRHFYIKSFEGIDDYRAMYEVLQRRFARLSEKEFGHKPDLILVDGGYGHVSTVLPLCQKHKVAVAGMVKDQRHRTRGLVDATGREIVLKLDARSIADDNLLPMAENAFDDAEALRLGKLRLITVIQDEAHRFANKLRVQSDKKRNLSYKLENIKGVGAKRRAVLLKQFGSLNAIAAASREDILEKTEFSPNIVDNIYTYFHPETRKEMSEKEEK